MSDNLSNLKPYTARQRWDSWDDEYYEVSRDGVVVASVAGGPEFAALLNDAYQAGIKKGREIGTLTIQDVLPSEAQVAKHHQA